MEHENEQQKVFWDLLEKQKILDITNEKEAWRFNFSFISLFNSCIDQANLKMLPALTRCVEQYCPEISIKEKSVITYAVYMMLSEVNPFVHDVLKKEIRIATKDCPDMGTTSLKDMMSVIIKENKDA